MLIMTVRYKNQLLYGCQDPSCCTPTCASYRRRACGGPYRRYTDLSARTLACYLASLDNAEDGLCRNKPRVHHEFQVQDRSHRIEQTDRQVQQAQDLTGECDAPGTRRAAAAGKRPAKRISFDLTAGSPPLEQNIGDTQNEVVQAKAAQIAEKPQRRKDPKSLAQNLFDTLALQMVEWLPLRRPSRAVSTSDDSRQGSGAESRTGVHQHPNPDAESSNQGLAFAAHDFSGAPQHTPLSKSQGGQHAAVELTFPNQQFKDLSLAETDPWSQNTKVKEEKSLSDQIPTGRVSINALGRPDDFTSMQSPPALKRRRQKHKGVTRTGDTARPTEKREQRVSWDSMEPFNDAQLPAQPSSHPYDKSPAEVRTSQHEELKDKDPDGKAPSVEAVTHLTNEIIDGLGCMMIQSEDDAQRWKRELAHMERIGGLDNPDWRFASARQHQVFNFVAQTVFYTLGGTRQALRSFRKRPAAGPEELKQESSTHLDLKQLQPSFRRLFAICPWDIALHSLWTVLEKVFVPPKELSTPGRRSRRLSGNPSTSAPVSATAILRRASDPMMDDYISDANAADIATIAFFALISRLPDVDARTWREMLRMRAAGSIASNAEMRKFVPANTELVVEITDKLEHDLALRLVHRLIRALTARLTYSEISKAREVYTHESPKMRKNNVLDFVMDNLSEHHDVTTPKTDDFGHTLRWVQPPSATASIVEWLRTFFLREWDGNAEIARGSGPGGAVLILLSMYKQRHRLGLIPEDFHTPCMAERLDPMEMPVEWLGSASNNKTMHLLSYSFLFPPPALVIYFRVMNYNAMNKYYETALMTTRHITQTAFGAIQIQDDIGLLNTMKTSMNTYLVLIVRRDNILTDALNQLWRREKREILRPLKVQMGMDEGEEGLDHGGVQQEFFRIILAEILDPAYGMFTRDPRIRTSWFQPNSLEPLYKFELLGLLVSLATYNGLTLPINFPIAFYRKLLGLKVKHLDHVRDGWPELVQGLESLLTWNDGDVGDVFMRTYEFSYEALGKVETIDMQSAAPATDESPLVTNVNRHQFVKDYISWLTDKSIRPQFDAFLRGFHTCLDRSALSIFTPEALKTVVEGIQEIDVKELEQHTKYEGGFGPTHRVVCDFWSIVHRYSAEKKARLLEFITASDRVPVNGISSIMFYIQKNGVGDTVSLRQHLDLLHHTDDVFSAFQPA